jgi:hypothetical protein
LLYIAVSLVAIALMAAPNVKEADCTGAANRYKLAVVKVAEAIRTFEKCVASGDKRNDCTEEFDALDSAHDDFVEAIESLKACP